MDPSQVSEERFVFQCEWFDAQADLIRKYLLTFYTKDSTIEMVSDSEPFLIQSFIVRCQKPAHVPQTHVRYANQTIGVVPGFYRYSLLPTAQTGGLWRCVYKTALCSRKTVVLRFDQAGCVHAHWQDN